ncbi:hypothetical protein AB0B50_40195 [Streptomyces sp. NPDC041068]|uniref:hypothetical protein n=1 Tax=Streptomyces sp. NPDC041068 TaxID=3155130 RepID=UPI0033FF2938
MRPDRHVWLRGHDSQPVRDTHGAAISFRITASQVLADHGTWHQLRTAHPTAQDIFGGWHTGLTLIPVPFPELAEGTQQ